MVDRRVRGCDLKVGRKEVRVRVFEREGVFFE